MSLSLAAPSALTALANRCLLEAPSRALDTRIFCMVHDIVDGNSLGTAALIEARAMDADPLRGLAQSFFAAIQDFLAAPWAVAESDFIYEKTRGQRPDDFHQRLKLNLALQRVASEDATVHQIMSEVTHLVKRSSALRDPRIVSRVTALMSASA